MKKDKGFTLIELLVVIAIIGILATIVISNLNNARIKSKDAAVKSDTSSFRSEAELNNNGSYLSFCDPGGVYEEFKTNIENKDGSIESCDSTITSYRIIAGLPSYVAGNSGSSENAFCINSAGTAKDVFLTDINTVAPPNCYSGENTGGGGRTYTWGCWGFETICIQSYFPGETVPSPPSAPSQYCEGDPPCCGPFC